MRTILLKFAGPMQAWGTDSHFETRHTDFYPSKSAVIGIIAASLGYKRDEDEKIRRLNELDFAVRIDQQGTLMRDYHTAVKYKPNGDSDRTYVTNRYYLEDAVFVAAVSHEDNEWILDIKKGLETPCFQPFMGRRSLPVCADFILKVTEDNALESLRKYEWQAADWYGERYSDPSVQLEVFVDRKLAKNAPSTLRKDRVISFSQKERKFGFRYESRLRIDVLNQYARKSSAEHDVFAGIGE